MKRLLFSIFLLAATAGSAIPGRAQRVGLVLSGGGAKGLYHVGVLKALEENNIPVDYVAGASMGAIVAGMYAAGYSPDEMIRFFITDSVSEWLAIKGPDPDNKYYFKRFEPTPEMVSVRVDPSAKLTNSVALQLPTNIISPYKLDIAFIEMLAPASAAAGDDFDRLMVPFRCDASDIYHKKTVFFDHGSLPFAIRTSMTIPMAFKPLSVDSTVLFDGGLYNNYPWQPLMEDFAPEILIGSICATNYDRPDPDNIGQLLSVMTTAQTDYSLPRDTDLEIRRKLSDINTLDYNKASYIIACGYEDAMARMPAIKAAIERRVSDDEIAAKRSAFKARIRPLVFEDLEIEGLNPRQTEYVRRQLGIDYHTRFTPDYFHRRYMQVLAGGVFTSDFPEVTYNPGTGLYRLKLKMKTKPSLRFSLGGNISSTSLNQGFVAANFQTVGRNVSTFSLNGYFGTFYNAVQVGGRHDLYTNFPFYVDYSYSYEGYDYDANIMKRYYEDKDWRYLSRNDNFISGSIAIPVLKSSAFRGKVSLGSTNDRYFTGPYSNLDTPDRSNFKYATISAEVQTRSMNHVFYPSLGTNERLMFRYVYGLEGYTPGSLHSPSDGFRNQNRNWIEARYHAERYGKGSRWFNIGVLLDATFSTHPSFQNPVVTAMTEPAFAPIPAMQTMFMPEYRSASYIGAGIIPVINFIKNSFYLKTYAFGFLPQEVVYDQGWVPAGEIWRNIRDKSEFVFGGSLVYQTVIGPASFTVNKFTTGPRNWQFMFNFGYTLFSSRKF